MQFLLAKLLHETDCALFKQCSCIKYVAQLCASWATCHCHFGIMHPRLIHISFMLLNQAVSENFIHLLVFYWHFESV
jgi:hypothetical protein